LWLMVRKQPRHRRSWFKTSAIIKSFSAELYGLRSHKTKKLLNAVKEATLSS